MYRLAGGAAACEHAWVVGVRCGTVHAAAQGGAAEGKDPRRAAEEDEGKPLGAARGKHKVCLLAYSVVEVEHGSALLLMFIVVEQQHDHAGGERAV